MLPSAPKKKNQAPEFYRNCVKENDLALKTYKENGKNNNSQEMISKNL